MKREPFRPDDPFDAMAESFRLQVVDMMLDADKAAIFRELPNDRKLAAFMAGALTGFFGVCMACVHESQRDELFDEIMRYMPQARRQADEIAKEPAS